MARERTAPMVGRVVHGACGLCGVIIREAQARGQRDEAGEHACGHCGCAVHGMCMEHGIVGRARE